MGNVSNFLKINFKIKARLKRLMKLYPSEANIFNSKIFATVQLYPIGKYTP